MISNVGKKSENNSISSVKSSSDDLKSFTNTEDVKDFYEYTGECLKRISCLKQPTAEEIKALEVELPITKEELQGKH